MRGETKVARRLTSQARVRYQGERFWGRINFGKEGPLILRGRSSYLIVSVIALFAVLTFISCSSSKNTASGAAPASGGGDGREVERPGFGAGVDAGRKHLHIWVAWFAVCTERLSAGGAAQFQLGQVQGKRADRRREYAAEARIHPQAPGLGKDAYFARHTLFVLTDHGALRINIFKDTADAAAGEEKETKAEAAEKTLAEKAVTRMWTELRNRNSKNSTAPSLAYSDLKAGLAVSFIQPNRLKKEFGQCPSSHCLFLGSRARIAHHLLT
jgi:hypothetical protein